MSKFVSYILCRLFCNIFIIV